MAKSKNSSEQTRPRSESINLPDNLGRSALAAWPLVHEIFGGRVEKWNPTDEGVEAIGFSVYGDLGVDPETVVKDISSRTRRLDFLTVNKWVNGQEPNPYTSAEEITADTVQFYKGAVEEGSAKSPAYVKQAVAAYKSANALAKKRGPKAKTIRLDLIGSEDFDESILSNMESEDIAILQAALERVAKAKAPVAEGAAL